MLHHTDPVPALDHEWSTCWASWDRQDGDHQGSGKGTGDDGVRVQLLRANGLQGRRRVGGVGGGAIVLCYAITVVVMVEAVVVQESILFQECLYVQ